MPDVQRSNFIELIADPAEYRCHAMIKARVDLDQLASDAMLQTLLLGNNPHEVTREDARAIYAAAL
nr:hypothetical protein [Undibacterium pigrum]